MTLFLLNSPFALNASESYCPYLYIRHKFGRCYIFFLSGQWTEASESALSIKNPNPRKILITVWRTQVEFSIKSSNDQCNCLLFSTWAGSWKTYSKSVIIVCRKRFSLSLWQHKIICRIKDSQKALKFYFIHHLIRYFPMFNGLILKRGL